MRSYELTFIVDPVLSGDEIKKTAQAYSDMLKEAGASIVHTDEMGLRTLAYPINKRNSGVYYCIELQTENAAFIDDIELALRRDERIMRFLTYKLDKFGVKYNEDKRNGLIGKAKRPKSKEKKDDRNSRGRNDRRSKSSSKPASKPAPAPAAKAKPKAKAAVKQEEE